MEENNSSSEEVVKELGKKFQIVGKRHIHNWYTWAILGIVIGAVLIVAYIADGQGRLIPSEAAGNSCPVMPKPFVYFGSGQKSVPMTSDEYNLYLSTTGGFMPSADDAEKASRLIQAVGTAKTTALQACNTDLAAKRIKYSDICGSAISQCNSNPMCKMSGVTIPPSGDACAPAICTHSGKSLDCTSTSPSETINCSKCSPKPQSVKTPAKPQEPPSGPNRPSGDEPLLPKTPQPDGAPKS